MLKKVLIVDDSEMIHKMYRLVMHRFKCEFADAMNGQEALHILEMHSDIQLILLDINMPIMNGLQFMERALALGISRRIPVIVISTEGKEEDTILALQLGAKGFVKKPFKSQELWALIEKILPSPDVHSVHRTTAFRHTAEAC
jgi:two-component system chemotaxis response regulator CheY